MNMSQPKGFIALISALIISLVLLLIASGGSISGFYTRVNSLSSEYKEQSEALADACVQHALLALALETDTEEFEGVPISLGSGTCVIENMELSTYTFNVRAEVNDAHTNIEVTTEPPDFAIISYQERASF